MGVPVANALPPAATVYHAKVVLASANLAVKLKVFSPQETAADPCGASNGFDGNELMVAVVAMRGPSQFIAGR
ncbi:MAG: hypothetical protein IM620_11230 [Cytophagales bacterium]|nr:hypothetical protein [Cytophagales bacterium]